MPKIFRNVVGMSWERQLHEVKIKWHDYLRSAAAFVYAQSDTDTQVIPDSDAECDASTSTVANVSLVLLANSHISVEKET